MKIEKLTNVKLKIGESESLLYAKARKVLHAEPKYFKILKKSLDARDKGNIFYVYSIEFSAEKCADGENTDEKMDVLPQKKQPPKEKPVIVVGSGPAGLFCALRLLKRGITPFLIERGECVEEREKTLCHFHETGELNTESNVSFGEGGAGTFSDGKLNTGTHVKENDEVLKEFVKFGAPQEILYLNKPHIGSDKLKGVVKNMREYLIKNGARVLFGAKLVDIFMQNGRISGVEIERGFSPFVAAKSSGKTLGVHREKIDATAVILAVGHSARDTFAMLKNRGVSMAKKDFAVGVRIEHLQNSIGFAQYGEKYSLLPPADYKCVFHGERAAFTFCMCPGGYVMAGASEEGGVVTNGMSNYLRDGKNANSALIVQVTQADYPEGDVLSGVEFQRKIERAAYKSGGGKYVAPVQRVGDFLGGKESTRFGEVLPSYPRGTAFADIAAIFPKPITEELKRAIVGMDTRLKGFANPDALLTAAETRTSSPVRIVRGEDMQSISCKMLFPCGEGAGYAGGITSSAADGIRVADAVFSSLME